MIRIKQKKTTLSLVFAFVAVIAVAFLFSGCSNEEAYRLVKVHSYDGAVTVQREEKLNAFEGLQLIPNDTVSVGDKSFLELLADSDKHIAAEENTGFVLHSTGDENSGDITIDLLYGKSLFTIDNKLNESSTFEVNTPNATLSVRGTSFSVAYDEEIKTTDVEVYSGTVQLNSGDEEMLIEKDGIATIITTDEGVKIITNSTAGNPNAIAVPENTEKLFEIAMTYPQEEGYNATNAQYHTAVSDYTANETKADSNSKIFKKYIEIIKSHDSDISKYFEENKAKAVANTNKQADVTDWFGEMLSVKDKGFRIDKAIMDMSIYGSNINKKYVTSDTYKVNTEGVDMYFCANGVEISFYGGFEKSVVVTTTTAATTTTAPETTVPETNTAETTAITVPVTTVKNTISTPKENKEIMVYFSDYRVDSNGVYSREKFISAKDISENGNLATFEVDGQQVNDFLYGRFADPVTNWTYFNNYCPHSSEDCKTFTTGILDYIDVHEEEIKEMIVDMINNNESKRLDVTDWFPESLQFEFDGYKYRFDIAKATLNLQITDYDAYIFFYGSSTRTK